MREVPSEVWAALRVNLLKRLTPNLSSENPDAVNLFFALKWMISKWPEVVEFEKTGSPDSQRASDWHLLWEYNIIYKEEMGGELKYAPEVAPFVQLFSI